jgi:tetratricopeptide (TPR) repeat protein
MLRKNAEGRCVVVQPPSGPLLVGRETELRDLLDALDEAASGRGRLILVGGEPGIGKSRLADEVSRQARTRGFQVLSGRAWEDAGAPPYWPWVQALRMYLRSAGLDEVRRDLGPGAADLAQMLPELRDLVPGLPPPPQSVSESARFQLFDSTATFLRNVSRARPLFVVLDDLHASDTPSLLLLRFVATQMGDMPMLVVGTYRDVELTPDHPLTSAIADIAREPVARILRLGGLPPEAVAAYLRSTLDATPPEHLVAAVTRATSGNPLFVGEAVRLLSTEGRLSHSGDLTSLHIAVPPGIRAVIGRRIGHLGDDMAEALRLASAVGPEFSVDVLRLVGSYERDALTDLLDGAVEADLLAPVAGVRGRYRFAHDLVRETLYDELSPSHRARLHGQIATVLEDIAASATEMRRAELAYHFAMAALGADRPVPDSSDEEAVGQKAVTYAKQAADEASRSLAYEEAARLYRMALAVLDAEQAVDDPVRGDLLLDIGEVESRAGNFDAARAAFIETADIARRLGAGELLARAALGVSGRLLWARVGNDTRMIPLLQDALVMLGGSNGRLRVRLLTRLACAWRSSPERKADSAALSRQAVELARELDDRVSLGDALIGRFWATWWPDNPGDREATALEIRGIAEDLDDGERIADAKVMVFSTLIERGRLSDARVELAALGRQIKELRQPAHLWVEQTNRALLTLAVGDYAAAETWIDRELDDRYRVLPARDDLAAARSHRFLLRREQGRVAEEEASLGAAVDDYPWYPYFRVQLTLFLLDVGRVLEARSTFEELARDGFAALYEDSEWLFGMAQASEACALLSDGAAATTLYDRLLPYAGRNAVAIAEGSVGVVDRYLGLLSATLGRLDDAVRHLSDAQRINEGMGALPWAAHCQHDLAAILRRRGAAGDLELAEAADLAALATARHLGMALAAGIETVQLPAHDSETSRQAAEATFKREGEYWLVAFDGDSFRVRDSKGMGYLARLLATPNREVHSLELARLDHGGRSSPQIAVDDGLTEGELGDAGPALDADAVAAYRARITEIREELAEAEAWNDPERADRIRAEEQALVHEVESAFGLGGRNRPAASAAERARVSVTRAIRSALGRVGEQSDRLDSHFSATIRTGTFCSYGPDPRAPIRWRL